MSEQRNETKRCKIKQKQSKNWTKLVTNNKLPIIR